jgi:glycosyltransferase involved in cell wall biosynthesis
MPHTGSSRGHLRHLQWPGAGDPQRYLASPLGTASVTKVRVLWLIKGLGPGGAERLLVSFAGAADHEQFAYEAAYLLPWKDHLVAPLTEADVTVHCLDGARPAGVGWLRRLRFLQLERRFDVVHCHSPLMAAMARPVLRSIAGSARPALVYTEHNTWAAYGRATRWANRVTYGLDDVHLAVSEEARRSTPPRWRDRVEVLVHGVPVADVAEKGRHRDAMRAELGIGPGEVVVGTVANYRLHKDYPTLLRAARRVLDANDNIRFLAVGQGPLGPQIDVEHRRLHLGDRFELLGYRPDALRVMSAFDIFALSSTQEGCPVALMEALALGLPVVATSVGGIPEAVRDGQEGILVRPRRPDLLAAALVRVAGDADERCRFARAARLRGDAYDIGRAVARTEAIYRSVSRRRPS